MKHLQTTKPIVRIYFVGAITVLLALFTGILLGATKISVKDLFFQQNPAGPEAMIVKFVRLPRVLASLLCGSALAISGAVIQGVLANRLASPSIIGVNSGAGFAVTLCMALGVAGGWQVSVFAFLGAFITVMAVSISAKKWGASRGTVILIGVAVNSLLGALSDGVTVFVPDVSILRNDFRVGDFSGVSYLELIPAAGIIVIASVILCTLSNELDVLSLGEDNARALGMHTGRMRTVFLLLAAALAGAAVSVAGLLSFVGLLVPHAVRRIAGNESRHLIPLCALFGAGFVSLCDTIARVIFAPYEVPVGILMGFLGAPFFLFILIKGKGGHKNA